MQYPTIKLYLAAICFIQLQQGWHDPLKDTHQLSAILRGAQKQATPRTKSPISPALLQNIVTTILKSTHLRSHDRYLYVSAMTMAFFGCLRCGEITYPSTGTFNPRRHLTIKDIKLSKQILEVVIKHSKLTKNRQRLKGNHRAWEPQIMSSETAPEVFAIPQAGTTVRCPVQIPQYLPADSSKTSENLARGTTNSRPARSQIWDTQSPNWICHSCSHGRGSHGHHQNDG